jgi:hypothetical protein
MMLFACLLFAHILADFYLQRHDWIMCKVANKYKSLGLLKHIGVHVLLTTAALYIGAVLFLSQPFDIRLVIALAIIIITHYAIDVWKTYMGFTFTYFTLDQLGHLLVLVAISIWLNGLSIDDINAYLMTHVSLKMLLTVTAYLLAYKPLSILIQLILRPYLAQFEGNEQGNSGLQTAGEYIGALERTLVITFVLLDQFAGIGFLLAAKSVFRFGDMRRQQDRKLTEYIMLGTLLSFTFALMIGLGLRSTY